eukprot:3002123-Pyramimonas_sp.AAC.1
MVGRCADEGRVCTWAVGGGRGGRMRRLAAGSKQIPTSLYEVGVATVAATTAFDEHWNRCRCNCTFTELGQGKIPPRAMVTFRGRRDRPCVPLPPSGRGPPDSLTSNVTPRAAFAAQTEGPATDCCDHGGAGVAVGTKVGAKLNQVGDK